MLYSLQAILKITKSNKEKVKKNMHRKEVCVIFISGKIKLMQYASTKK